MREPALWISGSRACQIEETANINILRWELCILSLKKREKVCMTGKKEAKTTGGDKVNWPAGIGPGETL